MFKVVSPLNVLAEDARVSELIDYEKKEWKKDLVENLSLPHEATSICHLPLSHRLPEDRLMWHYHPKVVFTVRSAYMMEIDSMRRNYGNPIGESSSDDREGTTNAFIWNQPLPNKIKQFLWRAYRGILLTRTSLARRKVPVDPLCPTCGQGDESIIHVLRNCNFAKRVLSCNGLGWQGDGIPFPDFEVWLGEVQLHMGKEMIPQMIMTMWALWNGRNRLVFYGIREEPSTIVERAARLWKDFSEATESQVSTVLRPKALWCPPRLGVFKINTDGALFLDQHCVGLGVIIRDCEGQVIAVASKKIPSNFSATVVEAMAVRYTMVLAHDLSLTSMIVEGDSMEVVNALTTPMVLLTSLGLIIDDIQHAVAQFVNVVTFLHIHREVMRLHMASPSMLRT